MITKFLVIGDPHFKTSNVPDTEDFIEKTISLAKKEVPDFVIILGDVLHEHERLHTIPLNIAYNFIKAMASLAKTYILVGNHDMINNQQFLNQNHWMNGMKQWHNVIIVDKPTSMMHNNSSFVFCPYVPNGKFIDALESNKDIFWRDSRIIFAHQEFKGCKMGAIESQDGDIWDASLPKIISGHIHSNQKLLDGHIYYPGSAMQHAFGDPNNILAIIECDSESTQIYSCREIDLYLRKKRIVYIDLDNIDTYNFSNLLESKDSIKISLCGNYDDFKIFMKTQIAKKLINSGLKIVHKNKKQPQPIESAMDLTDTDLVNTNQNTTLSFENADDSLEKLIHTLVKEEDNPVIMSDFNYIFLGYKKDEELLLL